METHPNIRSCIFRTYSSGRILDLEFRLRRLSETLKDIHKVRDTNDSSDGEPQGPTLTNLQEELRLTVGVTLHRHGALLTALTGFQLVVDWQRAMALISFDTRPIDEHKTSDYAENFLVVESQTAAWVSRILAYRRENPRYDVFLSHSSKNVLYAQDLCLQLESHDVTVFLAERAVAGGDKFTETIRISLAGSLEVWMLITPESLESEWVRREWVAGWALGKRIVPILLRCDLQQVPDWLKENTHAIDYHRIRAEIDELKKRKDDDGEEI